MYTERRRGGAPDTLGPPPTPELGTNACVGTFSFICSDMDNGVP